MAFSAGAIEATLELNRNPFSRGLAEARAEAKRFSSETISPTVDLGDKAAKAQIDELRAKLVRLDHERVNIKVDVDRSALSRVEGLFGSAGRGVGSIPLIGGIASLPFKAIEGLTSGLQKLPALLEQVGQFASDAFHTISSTITNLQTGATTVTQVLGSLLSGLVSIVATGGAALIGFGALVVVFGAVASVVVSLVAALAALAASLAAAVAGATALFIGAFAAAVPVIGVLVAFFSRLVAVVQAHKAAQQAATQAAQQHKAALQSQHQALTNLTNAQQNLKDQTVAAFAAMKQSAIDYQHALLGVENAKLGIEGARLSLRQAKQDLKDFLQQAAGADASPLLKAFTNVDFNPESARKVFAGQGHAIGGDQLLQLQEKLFAVKQATQGVKNANSSYQDSLNALTTAEQKRNAFLSQGIAAYKPYENALRQVSQAQDRLEIATHRVSAAQVAYHQKLSQLSSTEQGFLGTLGKILKAFGDIAKAVSAPIFRGIENAFGSIQNLLADPGIQRGLVGIGRAIGSVIAQFGKTLDTKPWRAAIKQFLDSGAQLTRQGGKLFSGIANVLKDIAQAALPHVINGVKSLAGWFTDLGKRPGAIKSAVEFLVHQFKIWWDVAKALGGLIVAFMRNAAGAGGKLAGHLASILRHWTDWLNKHPGAVQKFFDHAVQKTERLLSTLQSIVSVMKTMIDLYNGAHHVFENWKNQYINQNDRQLRGGTANGIAGHPTVISRAISAVENNRAPWTSRINAGLAVLQLQLPADVRKRIEDDLRGLGYDGRFNAGSIRNTPQAPHGDPAPRTPRAGASNIHFHAHGIQDPQHFIAQAAPKVARHPGFNRQRDREAQKRGK